jgi:ribosome recycling factor
LKHIASISIPDSKTIAVQPFQLNMLSVIEKAIFASDLGLTPSNDGHTIHLIIPKLTEERRKDIMKIVKKIGEDTRIAIRNIRRDAIDKLKALEKAGTITEDDLHRGEKEAQEITDKHIAEIDTVIAAKEKEVMTV